MSQKSSELRFGVRVGICCLSCLLATVTCPFFSNFIPWEDLLVSENVFAEICHTHKRPFSGGLAHVTTTTTTFPEKLCEARKGAFLLLSATSSSSAFVVSSLSGLLGAR